LSGAARRGSGSAALPPLPGPPAPVRRGRGLRPECPGEEDQRGEAAGWTNHAEFLISLSQNNHMSDSETKESSYISYLSRIISSCAESFR